MQIGVEQKGKAMIIRVWGDLDLYHAGELRKTLDNIFNNGIYHLIFNIEKMPYIDSSGIGVLVYAKTTVTKKGGKMSLVNPQETILKVLDISRLRAFFEVYSSEDEALQKCS
ncbi:STAS domain-containing protein [Thermospira aquatica]|uniref:Anti-sigma factor antagonist n=1 Tax=Thermospira aquatica TaxID=2828656 RepID=A0AAX3BBT9_9SPIR|nr:STAS domain-containing protein [Thermospira aquatica]URA09474.1 STAS domain-containing protein [Thermospira aquatica]